MYIYYGKEERNTPQFARRIAEVDAVAKFIAKCAESDRENAHILMGDFNIEELEGPTFDALAKHGFEVFNNRQGSNATQTKFLRPDLRVHKAAIGRNDVATLNRNNVSGNELMNRNGGNGALAKNLRGSRPIRGQSLNRPFSPAFGLITDDGIHPNHCEYGRCFEHAARQDENCGRTEKHRDRQALKLPRKNARSRSWLDRPYLIGANVFQALPRYLPRQSCLEGNIEDGTQARRRKRVPLGVRGGLRDSDLASQ